MRSVLEAKLATRISISDIALDGYKGNTRQFKQSRRMLSEGARNNLTESNDRSGVASYIPQKIATMIGKNQENKSADKSHLLEGGFISSRATNSIDNGKKNSNEE